MVHAIWADYPEIESSLQLVKTTMVKSIKLPMKEIESKIHDYIDAPGKYLRSGLSLMVTQSLNQPIDRKVIDRLAAIEMLHLATLIHDDVIDQADRRRGLEVINQSHSNRIAIYAGDYLLSRSGRLMAESGIGQDERFDNHKVIEQVLIGELRQLVNVNRQDMTMVEYLRQIQGKTATLFGMALAVATIDSNLSRREVKRIYQAGLHIGMYFQILDDLIDYQKEIQQSGKPRFQDIQNGIYTAPYLLLKSMIGDLKSYSLDEISRLMIEKNIYDQTKNLANRYLRKAQNSLKLAGIDNQEIFNLLSNL